MKLFLPKKLPDPVTVLKSTLDETGEEIKVLETRVVFVFLFCFSRSHHVSQVIVTFKREKKAGDHDVVQFFNILFNRIFRLLKFSQHNRNFYDPAGAHSIKQYNLQVR